MIRFINITHYAGEKELYSGLNWHVKPGERIGLVGDNGTGKTTLLRMAVGEVEPTAGQVLPRRGARIGFLRQEIHAATGDITVLQEAMKAFEAEQQAQERLHELYDLLTTTPENEHGDLYEEIHTLEQASFHHDAGSAESDAGKILVGLGFTLDDINKPLASFSGGWQMRAHIARLLLERPDVLMLDEPTNHLDLESIGWLQEFLTSFQGALIVVSHDRYFLDRITNRTAWVAQKRLQTFATNYSGFIKEREEQEEMLIRRYKNQQEELAHHQEFIERFRAKASKATLVQSRIKLVEKIELIELPQSAKKARLRIPEPNPCGRNVVELKGIGKAYGSNRVFKSVDLQIELGDKVALVGRNGAGKSTLLKIIAGVLDYEGERVLHPKVQTEYFSQHRVDELNLDSTLLVEARPPGATQSDEQIRTLLGCFLFSGDDVFKSVRVLSGGEKSRLALARMMLRRGNLLLLDEPTNHLDISTREVLQQALREFPGTVVMISHDRYFIDGVATKIVEVGGGTARVHLGNYSEYLRKKDSAEEAEADLRGRGASGDGSSSPAPARNKSFDPAGALAAVQMVNRDRGETRRSTAEERRERAQKRNALGSQIKKLEQQIEKLEGRLAAIHALQADPDAYTKGVITPELGAEAKEIEKKLPEIMQEWEALSEEYSGLNAQPA